MINPSNPPDAISPQYFAVAIDKSPKKIFRVNIPDEDKKKRIKRKRKKENYSNAQSTRELQFVGKYNTVFAVVARFIPAIGAFTRRVASRGSRTRVAVLGEKVLRQADTGIAGRNGLKRATGQSRSFARIYGNRFTRLTKECRLPLRLSTCPRTDHGTERALSPPLFSSSPRIPRYFGLILDTRIAW